MKKLHRHNLIRLVVLHLLLLAYPLVSKVLHVHHGEHQAHLQTASASFEAQEKPCPVCDFDFYNFVPDGTIQLTVESGFISVYNSPEPRQIICPVVRYISLRAPPIA